MNISLRWLNDYVSTALSAEEIADRLTMAGLEVEEVRRVGPQVDGVVVGNVLDVREHPNADRLVLCDVDFGAGEPVQIVCGAPNVAKGQKVPVAQVGATLMLPDRKTGSREAVTLKKVKLRGETSEGMICSAFELGLGDDHEGILVLDTDVEPGTPFEAVLEAEDKGGDVVLDIELTPNRPDAASHVGVARDLAALTRNELRLPEVDPVPAGDGIPVHIEAPESCPRYVGLEVKGVTVGESPAWLRTKLEAVGLRPINTIVDATNFVMFEMGQPLHAFDLAKLEGPKIIVRESVAGESITTLDGKERKLPEDTLLICDVEKPVAVAGVMGGANSEVSLETTDILIESAYFAPGVVRQASKALGLSTDASYRFERGVDPTAQAQAAARCAQLIADLAGGTIENVLTDANPVPYTPRSVTLRPERVAHILGVKIPPVEIEEHLASIGFQTVQEPDGVNMNVTIPPFRPDVEREIDVVEEVARIYGYDRIPTPDHTSIRLAPSVSVSVGNRLTARVRDGLSALGFREVYSNSLLRSELAEQFADPAWSGLSGSVVETLNPVSQEMAALRPSLLPGMLGAVAYNQARDVDAVRFFEIGHVFAKAESSGQPVSGYEEQTSLLIALGGTAVRKRWDSEPRSLDFYDVKGVAEWLLEELRVENVEQVIHTSIGALGRYGLEWKIDGKRLGILAEVQDEVADQNDVTGPLFVAEFNMDRLVRHSGRIDIPRYRPLDRFPRVDRDLALTVEERQSVGPLLESIREAGEALLQDVRLFDIYEGEGVEEGKKSVAFALRFGADRTLTDKEVDEQIERIVRMLEERHNAELRA